MEYLVELSRIKPNPFQMRSEEDPEAVRELAIDIFHNGLLQTPAARTMLSAGDNGPGSDQRFQLIFGHTRLAAYELLATRGLPELEIPANPDKYGRMPINVRDVVEDRTMFEQALAENMKRQDLNPVEVARALKVYIDTFQATGEEAGQLFNMKGATVRGKVRLLDLPDFVLSKVAHGEIPEADARKLITINRVLSEKEMLAVMAKLENGDELDKVLEDALRGNKQVVQMSTPWMNEGTAGEFLWKLNGKDFPQNQLPPLTPSFIESALGVKLKALNATELVKLWLDQLAAGFSPDALIAEDQQHDDLLEGIRHLADPPVCLSCPFYMRIDGDHWCGWKACHSRKKETFLTTQMAKASKQNKIPVYVKSEDGATLKLNPYDSHHEKLVKEHADDLRLRIGSTSSYNKFNGIPGNVQVVAVGKLKEKLSKRDKERQSSAYSSDGIDHEEYQRQSRKRELRREALNYFLWHEVTPHLIKALKDFKNLPILLELTENAGPNVKPPSKSAPKKERIAFCHRVMLYDLAEVSFDRQSNNKQKNPLQAAAKYWTGLGKSWGATVPASVLTKAKKYDAELVAAETEIDKGAKGKDVMTEINRQVRIDATRQLLDSLLKQMDKLPAEEGIITIYNNAVDDVCEAIKLYVIQNPQHKKLLSFIAKEIRENWTLITE